jgi:excinuclease UvrABC nuclease subunit
MTKAGIYRITNKINNKIYIGQSIDLVKREKDRINDLSKFKL